MQFMPNQTMGYDRAITMFSPDGRLLQVEYAKKAVSLGATVIGVVAKDSVIIVADRYRTDKLLVEESVSKIFKIDDYILAASSGFMSDARILVRRARVRAQQHKITYGENIEAESIVKYIADLNQAYTQYGGARPFGISLLIGKSNEKSQLFLTEPSGSYFEYKAKAIGTKSETANKLLEDDYKENMSTEDAVKIAIKVFKKILQKDFDIKRLEVAVTSPSGIQQMNEAYIKKLQK